MRSSLSIPSIEEVYAAQTRLKGIVQRTPLLKLNYDHPQIEIYLKCEQFQPISSFKIRGATNAVQFLSEEEKQKGIVTASAGNMAQGVAWIARNANLPCRVLVPDTANKVKVKAIERLGGQVTACTFEQWWQVILTHQCSMLEGHFIHPVCDRHVIAGNGTIALEIFEDLPDCDAIFGERKKAKNIELHCVFVFSTVWRWCIDYRYWICCKAFETFDQCTRLRNRNCCTSCCCICKPANH